MPIVDLDDELSIVDEDEDTSHQHVAQVDSESVMTGTMSAMEDMSTMSTHSRGEDEREQQWIIDSILDNKQASSNNNNGDDISESIADDDSLYIMDLGNMEQKDNGDSKMETPKMRNARKKSPPPSIDKDYQNYMNVSSIVDDFGEEEQPKGWKSKVLGKSKNAKKPAAQEQAKNIKSDNKGKRSFGRKNTGGSSKSDDSPSEPTTGWRNKTLFRGNKSNTTNKKPQEQSRRQSDASEPYEANLAPLGGIDDLDADVKANEEANQKQKKKEGWMSSLLGSMHDSDEDDDPRNEKFESLYAATVAPPVIGAVKQDDVEANIDVVQDGAKEEDKDQEADDDDKEEPGSWGSRMSALISSVTETKAGTNEQAEDSEKSVTTQSVDDEKSVASSVGLTDSIALANDLVSFATSLTTDNKAKDEKEEDDTIVALATSLTNKTKGEDIDEETGEMTESKAKGNGKGKVEETEGSFVSSNKSDDLIVGWGNSNDDDDVSSKKSWKSKVKSVRKSGSSKLSSSRKSGKPTKSFTQSKMKAMDAVDGDTSTDSGHSATGNNGSTDSPVVAKGISMASPNRKKILCVAVVALIFVILIVGATLGGLRNTSSSPQDSGPPPNPPEIPPQDVEYLFKLLLPISGNDGLTDDPESPQFKSFLWVAQDSALRNDPDDVIILRYVAAVVYYSLGGETWTNQYNFLSHDELCSWNDQGSGILCSNNEVYEIQLADNNLFGTIPDEIRHLPQLRSLHMEKNKIKGMLPSAIGQLDWLDELNLSSNFMTGTLPYTLYVFKQLRDIALDENSFTGTLPPTLGDNAVLERFSVSGNKLSGPFPRGIAQSPILKHVDLTDNELTGTLPEFATYASVKHLHIGRNDFEGTIPETLAEIPFLESLEVHKNDFTGTVPRFITTTGSIRHLEIRDNEFKDSIQGIFNKLPPTIETVIASNNKISGTIPTYINNYTLTQLRLEDNDIFGTIPTELGECTGLSKALHLSGNRFNGTIPVELGNLNKLESLRLRINRLTGTIPAELGQLTLLEDIWLDSNNLVGDIPEELADLPNLHTILLSENNGLTGELDPFCSREEPFKRFGVNSCDDDGGLDCPCCNICCQDGDDDDEYGCFAV